MFNIFSKRDDQEHKLITFYTAALRKMLNDPDAERNAMEMYKNAVKESKATGSFSIPNNFGEIILGHAHTDDSILSNKAIEYRTNLLPIKRLDGVRDDDIKWWWGMHDVERRMLLKLDELQQISYLLFMVTDQKFTQEVAITELRKSGAIYIDSELGTSQEDDKALPFELKNRIGIFLKNRNTEELKKESGMFSTFNAYIRAQIREGKL